MPRIKQEALPDSARQHTTRGAAVRGADDDQLRTELFGGLVEQARGRRARPADRRRTVCDGTQLSLALCPQILHPLGRRDGDQGLKRIGVAEHERRVRRRGQLVRKGEHRVIVAAQRDADEDRTGHRDGPTSGIRRREPKSGTRGACARSFAVEPKSGMRRRSGSPPTEPKSRAGPTSGRRCGRRGSGS
jgi:hypothetical protein